MASQRVLGRSLLDPKPTSTPVLPNANTVGTLKFVKKSLSHTYSSLIMLDSRMRTPPNGPHLHMFSSQTVSHSQARKQVVDSRFYPSAIVTDHLAFSEMREDLKTQNLTFTEIAKLVGENWQSLAPAEKEVYETHANSAKEKYHRDMVEYKKTSDYRRYAHYLHDFKEKQAKQNQGA